MSAPRTYRTRVGVSDEDSSSLLQYAVLFGEVGRKLHAAMEAETARMGEAPNSGAFKKTMMAEYGITGRQFNAIAATIDGKRKGATECLELNLEEVENRVAKRERKIATLGEELTRGRSYRGDTVRRKLTPKQRDKNRLKLHHLQRAVVADRRHVDALRRRLASHRVSIAFGSRDLFRRQFILEENGFADHAEWRGAWAAARDNQFMVLGSKDETGGNQGATASVAEDGSITLRIRLPNALTDEKCQHVTVTGLRFAYGHDAVVAAIRRASARRTDERAAQAQARRDRGKYAAAAVTGGVAFTWRFVLDDKGWEALVTFDLPDRALVSSRAAGRLGVDINADHFAVAETDPYGNYLRSFTIPFEPTGSTDQRLAALGDAVKELMRLARAARKPIVLEKLDFKGKKRALAGEDRAYARMLSSFAYAKAKELIEARAFDAGLEVQFVNPAFTSVIGRVKYAVPLGISVHEAAALAIARRGTAARERAPRPGATLRLPVKGGVTAWTAPARMPFQHRTHPWRYVARTLPRLHQGVPVRNPAAASARNTAPAAGASGSRSRTVPVTHA